MLAQILAILNIIETLLPVAIKLVDTVEAQFPQSGLGAQKLDMVKNALQAVTSTDQNMHSLFDQAWPALNTLINGTVAIRKVMQAAPAATAA